MGADIDLVGIGVLGPLTVDGTTQRIGPRDRVVLSALALHPGEVVSAERLADALWGERPPSSWSKVVQGCVVRLRRALGAATIETTPQGYRLVVAGGDIDAQLFERSVRRARELLTLGEPDRAAYVADEALALWRGRALADLDGWEEGRLEAGRLEELRRDAEELRIDAALRAGHYREVLAGAQSLVSQAPLRERRWELLALAEYQAGRQAEALRTLRQARALLANELGLDPSPDLVALEQAILRQDPSLVSEVALAEPSATCPYQGLLPYDVEDADNFFGRDSELASCLRRLTEVGSLTVVGPSGSGKSSLVRAGVAASLKREGRRVVVITPGAKPMDALTALPSHGPAPVLVVDQCEEAITLCRDETERTEFFATVASSAARAPVVVALRADRMGALTAYPQFAQLVERSLYLLRPLGEADLRAAIEGPARQAGLLLEPGLVDLLVREADGEPGALPLLSHALSQTWALREGRTLTVAGYQQTGGIRGAVAQSAERLYEQVPAEQRPFLRDLLLRLVTPTPDGEPVRSPLPLRVVASSPEHEQLIERLVTARLVTSDDGVVELSHEALARAWPRLRTWLDDDVEGHRILRHLSVAADSWQSMGRPDSELYRGARLAQAMHWQDTATPDLNPTEHDFLAASRHLAETEHHSAQQRAHQQARTNQRLRGLLAGIGLLLVLALVAGLLAVREADRADDAAIAADARRVGAQALVAEDPDRSLLLAVEGVRLHDSADTRANLLGAMSKNPALIGSVRADDPLLSLKMSPNGEVFAVSHFGGRVEFFDTATKRMLGSYNDVVASRLAFRPDGTQLAVGNQPGQGDATGPMEFDPLPVHLIDPKTFAAAPVQLGGMPERAFALALDYSADGRFLAVCFDIFVTDSFESITTVVAIWDLSRPEQPISRIDLPGSEYYVALSPDGSLAYIGHADPPSVATYEVASAQQIATSTHAGGVLALSPDGVHLAGAAGSDIALLDAATLQERAPLRRHTNTVRDLEFSNDGALLASGSGDASALVWDVPSGELRHEFTGHSASVWAVEFSPDGHSLFTAAIDETVLEWDLNGERRFIQRGTPAQATIPPDPGWAFAGIDAVAYVYHELPDAPEQPAAALLLRDIDTGQIEVIDTGHGEWGAFAWRPDGNHFATAGADGFIRIWDAHTREVRTEAQITTSSFVGMDYSADGTRLVAAELDGRVISLDGETLQPAGPETPLEQELFNVFVSPDGSTAMVLTSDDGFAIVDLAQGRAVRTGSFGSSGYGTFSPDGRLFVNVGADQVSVMDVESGTLLREPVDAHRGDAHTAVYAPDGALFATSGRDGRIGLWDGQSGTLLSTVLPGNESVPMNPKFLPDGHTLLIASDEGDIYTWDTRLEHWIDFACQVAGRNLTEAEWRDAFADRPYRETCPATD